MSDKIPAMNIQEYPKDKHFPWIVLGLLLLTFGLFTPWLGFYFDDWPVITNLHLRDLGTFWDFHRSDRPVAAWTYIAAGPIAGTRPIAWQFFSIIARWATVLGSWWLLRGLWPAHKREAAWMALLFSIFPAFDQQAISVAYSQHWMIFALFCVSMGSMLQAERDKRRFWLWTTLSASTMLAHIFSMEYFSGLELLRPLFLIVVAAETHKEWTPRLIYSIKRWLPYSMILGIFVFWRLVIYPQSRGDPNNPRILFDLFNQPVSALLTLAQYAVQDFLNIMVGSWYKTLDPSAYVLNDRIVVISLVSAMVVGVLTFLILRGFYPETKTSDADASRPAWIRQAIIIGIIGVLLGVFPVWLTGRQTTLGLYGSRFSLASMLGASIFTIAALEWITPRRLTRILLLSLLISIAVGYHIRRVEIFNRSWVKQQRFYWQLFWRIPELKSGASIAADGELFLYVGRYSTALALNLLYPEDLPYPNIGHYFYELPERIERRAEALAAGEPIDWKFRNFLFKGSTRDIVLVYYEPELGNCLWVLEPGDVDNPELPLLTAQGLPVSNLNVILPDPEPQNGVPAQIFGAEPEHNWCYFFQKADLARQFGNWQDVVDFGSQAESLGHTPNNQQEWIPFIEGYARTGRWDEAIEKTLHVRRVNFRVSGRLCRLWERVTNDMPVPEDYNDQFNAMLARLECSTP
jgi:hypothetical protein